MCFANVRKVPKCNFPICHGNIQKYGSQIFIITIIFRIVCTRGEQKGRAFYKCEKLKTEGDCGFFMWVDAQNAPIVDAFSVPRQSSAPTRNQKPTPLMKNCPSASSSAPTDHQRSRDASTQVFRPSGGPPSWNSHRFPHVKTQHQTKSMMRNEHRGRNYPFHSRWDKNYMNQQSRNNWGPRKFNPQYRRVPRDVGLEQAPYHHTHIQFGPPSTSTQNIIPWNGHNQSWQQGRNQLMLEDTSGPPSAPRQNLIPWNGQNQPWHHSSGTREQVSLEDKVLRSFLLIPNLISMFRYIFASTFLFSM